jgi:PAS domain S-box-containing protein
MIEAKGDGRKGPRVNPTDSTLTDPQQIIADLRRQLAERTTERDQCRAERDEALEQQTATAEVLGVINASPGNLIPVFDAMLEKAVRLCDTDQGVLRTFDGEKFNLVSGQGDPVALLRLRELGPIPAFGSSWLGRIVQGERIVHVEDVRNTEVYQRSPIAKERLEGVRTWLAVALYKDGALLGVIIVSRREVRPFTDKQIALLQNFAAQAVIAMENARLLGELRERTGDLEETLRYQTATSDVLQVISRSMFDLEPVLDRLAETATRLCTADMALVFRRQDDGYRAVSFFGLPVAWRDHIETTRRQNPNYGVVARPGRATIASRVLLEGSIVHVHDVSTDPEYERAEAVRLGGLRTVVGVPLLREGEPIGVFTLCRQRVEPFTDRQIELVRTFADQAVIAMENARLITETREALEQQTATAEVLGVINSSPGDLAPVFDAMLEKACLLCEAQIGTMWTYQDETMHAAAIRGAPPAYAEFLRRTPTHPIAGEHRRLLGGERFIHNADITATETYRSGHAVYRAAADLGGIRTFLGVPLRRDDELLGHFGIYRQEVRPFSDKQTALLQNFAAQAVVAMENARLITETRDALAQQTATAEVLGVINSSPGDLTPVFDAMLEKAMRLCEADIGNFWTYDGETCTAVAMRDARPEHAEWSRQHRRGGPGSVSDRLIRGESVVHIPDAADTDAYRAGEPARRAAVDLNGVRTLLAVALRKGDELLGYINIIRRVVRPFSDRQIALLQNFAAQAVIAMENARLITETRQRTEDLQQSLEYQTATSDVLKVISRSTADVQPVLDTVVRTAARLCGADLNAITIREGEVYRYVASNQAIAADTDLWAILRQRTIVPGRDSVAGRVALEGGVVHVADISADPDYAWPEVVASGLRSVLGVPLLREGEVLGTINLSRKRVQPFTERQIELVRTFADQAVIAIENARLINETREALEQQTATSEVLQVINSSPGDLQLVFDAILEKAHLLLGASHGVLVTYDGDQFCAVATHGLAGSVHTLIREPFRPTPASPHERMVQGELLIQVPDLSTETRWSPGDPNRMANLAMGIGTLLFVSLRNDDRLLGYITAARLEVKPFTDKEIALLQNFAAQAVIAMENARLITETREALEQQTATAEVLSVINASPGDLQPVFEAMLDNAMRLCGAAFGLLSTYDGERFHQVALRQADDAGGEPARFAEYLALISNQPGPGSASDRLLSGEHLVHIYDLSDEDIYRSGDPYRRAFVDLGAARTLLAVPLHTDKAFLGVVNIYRQEVRPFTDKQIALLENFAAQAVIAMENARLLGELQDRTGDLQEALEYQTATSDVLKVISRSTFDLHPVFEAIVTTAARLCEADTANIGNREDEGVRIVATYAASSEFNAFFRDRILTVDRGSVVGRTTLTGAVVHVSDVASDPEYNLPEAITLGSYRTTLGVPLLREGVVIGVITLARARVEPFTDRQIELVRTFADQAVIAIQNAWLLNEIRQRQAELRVTLDNMADGVAMFDAALRLTAWNRNFRELLDLPEDFLAAHHTWDEYIRYLTERGEFGESDAEAQIDQLRSRLADHYSFERSRPDGTVIEVRHNPMPDGGVVLIYGDITERKRSEEEVRAARDAAEAAYHDLQAAQANLVQAQKMAALGQLTAGIAHEIKNPLNFVNNFASLSTELLGELKEDVSPALATLDGDKREGIDETIEMLTGNLEKIVEHGHRADNIVKSMLEHSRGVSGERREVDINNLIEDALNLAYHGARAQDQGFNITLKRDYEKSLKPIEVAPQEITRVFLNLFGNGFYAANKRAHDKGDGSFRPILSVATREDGDAVEVRVRDNGTGIPPDIRDKLFQPFFTTKPTGEGTGLGLSISYDIVTQQHGGTITVESEPGSFTEFIVRLPRH